MRPEDIDLSEVLFEFRRVGNVVRVAALDPVTNTEVTMVGVPGYGEHLLKRIARRKLAYVIAKNAAAEDDFGYDYDDD